MRKVGIDKCGDGRQMRVRQTRHGQLILGEVKRPITERNYANTGRRGADAESIHDAKLAGISVASTADGKSNAAGSRRQRESALLGSGGFRQPHQNKNKNDESERPCSSRRTTHVPAGLDDGEVCASKVSMVSNSHH